MQARTLMLARIEYDSDLNIECISYMRKVVSLGPKNQLEFECSKKTSQWWAKLIYQEH